MLSSPKNFNISNPFQAARIFLSHSWDDNREADYIFKRLNKVFNVWYDRDSSSDPYFSSGIFIGDPVLPRKIISSADFILFLASKSSMDESKTSFRELGIAERISQSHRNNLGLIELKPYQIPDSYKNLKFEKFSLKTADKDIARIIVSIKNRLTELGKLTLVQGYFAPNIYSTADDQDLFLETIEDPLRRGIYALNTIPRALEREKLINNLLSLSKTKRNNITNALYNIYLGMTDPIYSIARQNAVYIVSRLNIGAIDLVHDFRRRHPPIEEGFLYRGFHIACGFLGNLDSMHEYVRGLYKGRSKAWANQRHLNLDFHCVYYGSKNGALLELRDTLKSLHPINLLELNVFTLGNLSDDSSDVDLLTTNESRLISEGVDPDILKYSINSISKKSK